MLRRLLLVGLSLALSLAPAGADEHDDDVYQLKEQLMELDYRLMKLEEEQVDANRKLATARAAVEGLEQLRHRTQERAQQVRQRLEERRQQERLLRHHHVQEHLALRAAEAEQLEAIYKRVLAGEAGPEEPELREEMLDRLRDRLGDVLTERANLQAAAKAMASWGNRHERQDRVHQREELGRQLRAIELERAELKLRLEQSTQEARLQLHRLEQREKELKERLGARDRRASGREWSDREVVAWQRGQMERVEEHVTRANEIWEDAQARGAEGEALQKAAGQALEHYGAAIRLLGEVAEKFPEWSGTERVKSYRAELEEKMAPIKKRLGQ